MHVSLSARQIQELKSMVVARMGDHQRDLENGDLTPSEHHEHMSLCNGLMRELSAMEGAS